MRIIVLLSAILLLVIIGCNNSVQMNQESKVSEDGSIKTEMDKIDFVRFLGLSRRNNGSLNYTICFEETYIFLYNGRVIYKLDFPTLHIVDSLYFPLSENIEFNLISKPKFIGVLCFSKADQYDLTIRKNVLLYEFTESLELNKIDTFSTEKYYHLLSEDFNYVSYYSDSVDGELCFWFNEKYNNLQIARNKVWVSERLESSYVDIKSGTLWNATHDEVPRYYLVEADGQKGHMFDDKIFSYSIINGEIAYLNGIELIWCNMTGGAKMICSTHFIDPIRRSKGHVYQVFNDTLYVWPRVP